MIVYFVRTNTWKLNKSFQSLSNAKQYQNKLLKHYKLKSSLLKNGVEIN